ncbi:MAG: AI-2E family transporter [Saccharospirillum sp.]
MNLKRPSPIAEAPLSRALVTLAAIVIILTGMRFSQPILVPTFLAAFLAVLTSPAVTWMVRHKVPLAFAIGLVVTLVFAFTFVLGGLVASSAEDMVRSIPEYERQLDEWLESLRNRFPWLAADVRSSLQSMAPPDNFIAFAGRLFSGVGSILIAAILMIFILIFMLYEGQSLRSKMRRALGNDDSVEYMRRFTRLVQRYLVIKTLVSALTGLTVWALMAAIQVDFPILWGTFAFFMNFIPNIGSLIAAIPAVILAGLQQGLPGFVMCSVGFGLINAVIGNIMEPRLMGRSLDLSTLVVFLSLIFWGWVLGPVGTLLAVPLTVVVKIGLEVYPKSRWIAILLSD